MLDCAYTPLLRFEPLHRSLRTTMSVERSSVAEAEPLSKRSMAARRLIGTVDTRIKSCPNEQGQAPID